MVRVGLTGGIGAGKSSVSRLLAERGALVVDSDALAREVVEPGTPGLDAVVAEFGPEILTSVGGLDRPRLGRLVFADTSARRRLEAIVHPLVRARAAELERAAPAGTIVVQDVPLLVETGQAPSFDIVVVVEAPLSDQVRRLVGGRGMTDEEAMARISAQATPEQRRAVADEVIVNDGSLEQLRIQVDALWARLLWAADARRG